MKNSLKLARILTWFNLIFWGLLITVLLLFAISVQTFPVIVVLILLSAVPLNCYASLQLQKSIRHPAIKLSNQTPVGIRFVGFVALFFAISFICNGVVLISNANEVVKPFREQIAQVKGADLSFITERYFRRVGAFVIFLGLCIGVNVILNFRLLRWYYLVRKSDVS